MKKRILFFAESVTLAHRMRPYVLANSLPLDSFDIGFATDRYFENLFPTPVGQSFQMHSLSPQQFTERLWKTKPFYDFEAIDTYVKEDLSLIDQFKPDLIVGDFRLSLTISAALREIPWINLTNCYWSPEMMQKWEAPDSQLTHLFGANIVNALLNQFTNFFLSPHVAGFFKAARKWKIAIPGNLTLNELYHLGDHRFYCDLPDFVNPESLKPKYEVLGPILWSPEIPLPPWWNQMPQDRPLIYLNLGSSGQHNVVPKLVQWLGSQNFTLLVGCQEQLKLPDVPYLYRAPYLPGLQACARAQLVVCNGGSPSTQQALSCGVPVLGICSNVDQMLNMNLVTRHELGLSMRSDQLNKNSFVTKVLDLINSPQVRAKAETMGRSLKTFNTATNFHDKISKILNLNHRLDPKALRAIGE